MSAYNREPLKIERGINIFSDTDFYWQVNVPVEKLRALEAKLESEHILEACATLGIPSGYVMSYHRSDFIYFLPAENRPDFTVLDIGSGFGNVTIPLAKKMPWATIHAVDASLDILSFLKARARKENCTNIQCSKIDLLEKNNLPFKEKSFDLIIMNGVLEWIGNGVSTGDPRKFQKESLAHIRTLLKDGGTLYIGIEGRFFPGYFKNVKDPHSQLRYTSIVPRKVADFICRRNGKKEGYRTYIYSHVGYKKLLRESGFDLSNLEIVYPVASYKDPFFLFSYQDHAAYRYAFRVLHRAIFATRTNNMLYRLLYMVGLEKFFAPSYLLLASNGKRGAKRLLMEYARTVLDEDLRFEPIKVLGNLSDAGYVSFFLLFDGDTVPRYVLKIKRIDESAKEINLKYETLRALQRKEFVLPVRTEGVCQLFPFIQKEPAVSDLSAVRDAIHMIRDIHVATATGSRTIGIHAFSLGFTHGDYTLDNIIRSEGVLKIIDFEDVEFDGIQLFDVFNLLLHFYRYVQKHPTDELIRDLFSTRSMELFASYDQALTLESVRAAFGAFVALKIEKYKNVRQSKYDFYHSLRTALDEQL